MSYINQVTILNCVAFFHSSKKGLSFPFSLGKRKIYLEAQSKTIYLFSLKIDSVPLVPTGTV